MLLKRICLMRRKTKVLSWWRLRAQWTKSKIRKQTPPKCRVRRGEARRKIHRGRQIRRNTCRGKSGERAPSPQTAWSGATGALCTYTVELASSLSSSGSRPHIDPAWPAPLSGLDLETSKRSATLTACHLRMYQLRLNCHNPRALWRKRH